MRMFLCDDALHKLGSLEGDVPRFPSYGVYISQCIRFTKVCSNVSDFNNRNTYLNAELLK